MNESNLEDDKKNEKEPDVTQNGAPVGAQDIPQASQYNHPESTMESVAAFETETIEEKAVDGESASLKGELPVQLSVDPKRKNLLILVKDKLVEKSPEIKLVPRLKLNNASRRSFLIYGAGMAGSAAGLWWMLPDEIKSKLGLASSTGPVKKNFLREILAFDDRLAESIFSRQTLVPTYKESDLTELPNNYAGATPDADYLNTWNLKLTGLADNKIQFLSAQQLVNDFEHHTQITRLVCVEGWSAISGWSGLRFADLLRRFPPQTGTRWVQLRSDVNLDGDGNSDPYFVSIDIQSALHSQTLLATHHNGKLLEVEHGAPLRLLAPMKLGLKNIKAITSITYSREEPGDYWNQYGYSYYDGI